MSRFKEAHCSECKKVMQIDMYAIGTHTGMCGPCLYDMYGPNYWGKETLDKLATIHRVHQEADIKDAYGKVRG
jgi:hypothetical protein